MNKQLKFAALLLLATFNFQLATVFAQGTAFTYQGRLNDGVTPANGSYDLRFVLYDNSGGNNQQGPVLTNAATGVSNGLFTVTLDFGNQFPGAARWLEIGVRTNGAATFITLAPRQPLTPAPYAITAGGVVSGGLSAGTYSNALTLNNPANQFNGSFNGNGANVTNVNAATLGGFGPTAFWKTAGNTGTAPGTNFLGTLDNQPLELRVNGQRALRIEPGVNTNGAPNVIGGSSLNYVAPGIVGATIGGGGATNYSAYVAGPPVPGSNSVGNVFGTIGGGFQNATAGSFSFIGGGLNNQIQLFGTTAAIVGGDTNTISSNTISCFIGAGQNNSIAASASYSTIVGGFRNLIQSNSLASVIGGGDANIAGASFATIGGGFSNVASNSDSTVVGGQFNVAGGSYAVAGGDHCTASGQDSVAFGGSSQASGVDSIAMGFSVASSLFSTAMGISDATGPYSTAMGDLSVASGYASTAMGNSSASGTNSTALGSSSATQSYATAMGYASLAGGYSSTAMGNSSATGDYSTAMGASSATDVASTAMGQSSAGSQYATAMGNSGAYGFGSFAAGVGAIANHANTFVWSDGDVPYPGLADSGPNQFLIHASGGVGIGLTNPAAALHVASASGSPQFQITQQNSSDYSRLRMGVTGYPSWEIDVSPGTTPQLQFWNSTERAYLDYNGNFFATSLNPTSDRNAKENFQSINPREVLDKVASLPITRWNFKADTGTPHVGPMAQDFHALFNVGTDDKHIATVDEDGVALAAIQGLNQKLNDQLQARDAEIDDLKTRLAEVEQLLKEQRKSQ